MVLRKIGLQDFECTHQSRTVNGIPCVHEIIELIQANENLNVHHFDRQWILRKPIGHELFAASDEPGLNMRYAGLLNEMLNDDVGHQDNFNFPPNLPIVNPVQNPQFEAMGTQILNLFQNWDNLTQIQHTRFIQDFQRLLNTPTVTVQDPHVIIPRGRPRGALNRSHPSNRRDPSEFEHVEKPERRCGVCNRTGHNRRSCAQSRQLNDVLE
jgi:hypothetical protein